MVLTLGKLIARVERYSGSAGTELIEKAYRFAVNAHRGQYRMSGDPFVQHPLEVAHILADLELDVVSVAAGLLHDVVEDTGARLEDLEQEFGGELALLVDGVTKLSRIEYRSQEEEQVENLRKMFLAMARDIRVLLVKLADRLHNMRTLGGVPEDRRKRIAEETLEIFAPLAHRLGISRLKWELEDLALRHIDSKAYYELVDRVAKKRRQREEYINTVVGTLRQHLQEVGVKADIQGRPKHFYSIYRKMVEQGKEFGEIYDLTAIRIIVDSVKDCYGALGVLHALWKPIPGRFKDYVAMPKPNMYQSLHTTVIGPDGKPLEIQIRTWEMHRTAEYGIAAHWRYKEGGRTDEEFAEKLSWLRQVLEWQHDLRDAREFMESLKMDVFSDEVFVFTPKADVISLPAGACPIDFAYRIHTDIGHRCVGAKVNGKIVPLDYELKNGDIVEILTSKQAGGPSWDWLNVVRTSTARNRIRQWFRRERREEHLPRGRELLEKEARRHGLDPEDILRADLLGKVATGLNFVSGDELLAGVGRGVVTAPQVVGRLAEEFRELARGAAEEPALPVRQEVRREQWRQPGIQAVKVKGASNILTRLSRCCNPLPGDPIVGYVTRGRGVSVHRVNCPNVQEEFVDRARLLEVFWGETRGGTYEVGVEISAVDRPGLLSEIMRAIADTRTNITAVNARTDRHRLAIVNLFLEIKGLDHLTYVTEKIKKVRDVVSVDRLVQ